MGVLVDVLPSPAVRSLPLHCGALQCSQVLFPASPLIRDLRPAGMPRSRSLCAAVVAMAVCALLQAHPAPAVDPDANRDFCGIVEAAGPYECTASLVTTDTGYILQTFRMHKKTLSEADIGEPVLLWHGLIDCSYTWLVNYHTAGLPYLLADAGYDVWFGNSQGTYLSPNNTHLDPSQEPYWQFSWDEMAQYNVPAVVRSVLGATGKTSLAYIGHSQGTTQMFASLVRRWTDPAQIRIFVALAPVAYSAHQTNAFLNALSTPLGTKIVEALIGKKEFLADTVTLRKIDEAACQLDPEVCQSLVELICGKHRGAFNNSRMAVVGAHEPGGTSVQDLLHWTQAMRNGGFAAYDWGEAGNMAHYNSTTPPPYPLKDYPSTVPLAMYTGSQDELADPVDVAQLLKDLPMKPVDLVNFDSYAHMDFVWCSTAKQDLYEPHLLPTLAKHLG